MSRNIVLGTTAVALAVGTYALHRSVSAYGWEGTFNLIWEGDPYIEDRPHMTRLDQVKRVIEKLEKQLSKMEEGLQRAELEALDGDSPSIAQWQTATATDDLRTKLALLSDKLDRQAAQVDQVVSHSDRVRLRKKDLSTVIVSMMKRADALIQTYMELEK